jgi:hypothetical protein
MAVAEEKAMAVDSDWEPQHPNEVTKRGLDRSDRAQGRSRG